MFPQDMAKVIDLCYYYYDKERAKRVVKETMKSNNQKQRRKTSDFQKFQRPSETWNSKSTSSQTRKRSNASNRQLPKRNQDERQNNNSPSNEGSNYDNKLNKQTNLPSDSFIFNQTETNYYFPESEKKRLKKTKKKASKKTTSSSNNRKKTSHKNKKRKSSGWKYFRRLLGIIIIVGLVFLFNSFVTTPTIISNDSMEPALSKGDWVLIDRLETPKQFQMVAFYNPQNKEEVLVQRLIGLPGDSITYKYDVLYVNSIGYMEPYLESYREALKDNTKNLTEDFSLKDLTNDNKVPKGKYFFLSDNRETNLDSRSFGLVSADEVIGTVNQRFLPIKNFGNLD